MAFKFEQLRVCQESLVFVEKINMVADGFPKKEFSEGSTGQTNAEQKRFLLFANRSTLEVVACLIKAKPRTYIDEKTFQMLYAEAETLVKMIQPFIRKLN